MATIYGNTTNHWRAYFVYSISESETAITITVSEAGMQSVGWGFQLSSGVSATIACTGQGSVTGSGGFYSDYGATSATSYVTATYTITKSESTKSVTLSVTTTNSSGYMNGTSTASVSVSIPALTSYTVSYNANGGSGAPANQTKYYGKTLTLSSTKPSRSGYSFVHWNTNISNTGTAYSPGSNYTANAALSLYAIWSQNYIAPTITNFKAYRCNSSGTAQADGTYIKLSCTWNVDTTLNSANKATKVIFNYRNVTDGGTMSTAWKTITVSTANGTTEGVYSGWSASSIYEFSATVYDSGGSSSASATVYKAFATLDVGRSGNSMGIGCLASETTDGLEIQMPLRFTGTSLTGIKQQRFCSVGQSSSTTTNPWYKFASISFSDHDSDSTITFKVMAGFGDRSSAIGVLTAHVRTNGSGYWSSGELVWEYALSGIDNTKFVYLHNTGTAPTTVELWAKCDTAFQIYHFEVINILNRTDVFNSASYWNLYTTKSAGSQAAVTSGLTQITSSFSILKNRSNIEASGTSGIWSYIKYVDGWAECWGGLNLGSIDVTTPYGSCYYAEFNTSFPFAFTEIPNHYLTVFGRGYGIWSASSHGSTTASTLYGYVWAPTSLTSSVTNLSVQIFARGKWK